MYAVLVLIDIEVMVENSLGISLLRPKSDNLATDSLSDIRFNSMFVGFISRCTTKLKSSTGMIKKTTLDCA